MKKQTLFETKKTPTTNEWFVCYVKGVRMILKYNVPNKFWADFCGKTYKPAEVDKWLNDKNAY